MRKRKSRRRSTLFTTVLHQSNIAVEQLRMNVAIISSLRASAVTLALSCLPTCEEAHTSGARPFAIGEARSVLGFEPQWTLELGLPPMSTGCGRMMRELALSRERSN